MYYPTYQSPRRQRQARKPTEHPYYCKTMLQQKLTSSTAECADDPVTPNTVCVPPQARTRKYPASFCSIVWQAVRLWDLALFSPEVPKPSR